ncbi:MAG: permease prefix domain 1-containing protein [Chloroflexota bacterium]|nr:permease prefix domain 1-containing protein [Chloroflexota bacterium]
MQSVEAYLEEVASHLMVDMVTETKILREIGGHLSEAVAVAQKTGLSAEEAERQAVAQFGPAREIAEQFRQVYNESVGQAVLSAALPVLLTMILRSAVLPWLRSLRGWPAGPEPVFFVALITLALLVPALTIRRWRYGYAAWAFFSVMSILQTGSTP